MLCALLEIGGVVAQSYAEPLSIAMENLDGCKVLVDEKDGYVLKMEKKSASFQCKSFSHSLPDSLCVLSFEYFCLTGLQSFTVMTNKDALRRDAKMTRDFPSTQGWSTFSIDLCENRSVWGNEGDYVRIILGHSKPTEIRLRNLRIRVRSRKEEEQEARLQIKQQREQRLNRDLRVYLNRDHSTKIEAVQVTDYEVAVSGDRNGLPGAIFLCEVPIWGDLTEHEFISSTPIEDSQTFKVALDRFIEIDGYQYDRIYSRWVLAQQTQSGFFICAHAHYPDQVKSRHQLPKERPDSRKGLGGYSISKAAPESDLDDLGITSATVNILLNQFLRLEPSDKHEPFDYLGHTYYFDTSAIRKLDQTLVSTAKRNIIVSAIILIAPESRSTDRLVGTLLEHPDFDAAGIYSMPDMTTPAAFSLYAAGLDFLAKRYSRPDKLYGRIHHWIAHNEVDAGWVWTNMGEKSALLFMDTYIKSMRALLYTARKYNPHAEVFITLTHYWQERHNRYCYPSAELLDLLIEYSHAEGDFRWGVAFHPYPQSLLDPKAWFDTKADFNYQTPQITFKNLEVIDAWIKQPHALYQGRDKRTLFLSEQGPNSTDYSESALREQAASMAYAWKKMETLDGIDAFQFHNWQDNRGEGGLRIGLRKFADDEHDPGGAKPIWHLYGDLATEKEDSACAFAKEIIGIGDWDEVRFHGDMLECTPPLHSNLQADTWVAVDGENRVLPGYETCGPRREDRYVGMFYFLTHNQPHDERGLHDVSKIKAANPKHPEWGKGTHYWGEPEIGYYIMQDEWVIRRHARLLVDAGIDVLIFDVTNDRIYLDQVLFIAGVFSAMRKEGEQTPQIAFLASQKSVLSLWDSFYHKGIYADLWFRWKGKPLLMFGQHKIPSRTAMDDVVFSEEITNFFNIKQSWAWTSLAWYDNGRNEWPWIDHYPQAIAYSDSLANPEYMPVAVAQHPLSNIGRSFHEGRQPALDSLDLTPMTAKGLHFTEQWSRALEVDPEFVFVTGWNEWTAGRKTMGADPNEEMKFWDFFPGAKLGSVGDNVQPGDAYFIDQYNQEYSRDIEPMKDGHSDNYYYQLISFVRRYKGVLEPLNPSFETEVDVRGSFEQWKNVNSTYYDHRSDVLHRNSPGNYASGPYVDSTGRNDIVQTKVTFWDDKVFFYLCTNDDITSHEDDHWLNLLIDVDQDPSTGWEGYDLLVDQTLDDARLVYRFTDGHWQVVARAPFHNVGSEYMLSIPRRLLDQTTLCFDFHWSDNCDLDEPSSLFLQGDHAPMRRSKYRFCNR